MKKLTIMLCIIMFQNLLFAGVITSKKTGNWSASSSWLNNETPSLSDTVFIAKGDTIYINSSSAICNYLSIEGTVFFRSTTNTITTNYTLLNGGLITGTATGNLTTDSLKTQNISTIQRANITVNQLATNHSNLIIGGTSGRKYFDKFLNFGTVLNPKNEDFTFGNLLTNNGAFNLKQSRITFLRKAEIKGSRIIEIDELVLSDTLITTDSLQINSRITGNQTIINRGTFLIASTNSNTLIKELDLSHQNNTIIFFRDGQQALNNVKNNEAQKIIFNGNGNYRINQSLNAKTLLIKDNSKLQLNNYLTTDSVGLLDNAVLDIKADCNLADLKNIFGSAESEIVINKPDTLQQNKIQLGTLTLNANAVLNLRNCDSLFIGGDCTGSGMFTNDNAVIYNGAQIQNLKEFDYHTFVINNSSNAELSFNGNYRLREVVILNGKLKIGSSTVGKTQIHKNGEIIIGASAPRFLDTTIVQGTMTVKSDAASPTFHILKIDSVGLFKNDYSAEIKIESILKNQGRFLATQKEGSTVIFNNTNASIIGNGILEVSKIVGSNINNASNILVTKSIDAALFENQHQGLLKIGAQQHNVKGSFDLLDSNNTIEFVGHNQIIPAQMKTFQNLRISGTGNTVLSNNMQVNNNLKISSGVILTCDSFQISSNNQASLSLDSAAFLILGHNLNANNIKFPSNFNTYNLHDSSTVVYQAKKDQTIKAMTYGNLIIDDGAVNESKKILDGPSISINGNFTIKESSVTFDLANNTANFYGDWNGLGKVKLNNGFLNIYGDCNSNGTIKAGNSTISYLGNKRQRIKVGTYYDLIINKNNSAYTRANLGSIKVTNDLWVKNGTLDFSTEKVHINHLLIDDSVTFSSSLQSKTFNDITVGSDGYFNLNIDDNILIEGDINNNGQFIVSQGSITFSDSAKNQTISGLGYYELQNLNVNKDSSTAVIACDLTLQDTAIIHSGKLHLQNATVSLGKDALIQGLNKYRTLTGTDESTIFTERLLLPGSHNNIAGLELNITTPTPMGKTTISRGFKSYSLAGTASIKRFYEISPSIDNNLNVTMSFNYYASELNASNEENMQIWKSVDDGANWIMQGGIVDTSNQTITLSNINSFSKWTAGNQLLSTLAVDLKSFTASRNDGNIILKWEVLTEVNTKAYLITFSHNGVDYDSLTIIPASNAMTYETTFDLNTNNTVFFKLIEIEEDGTRNFLDSIAVFPDDNAQPKVYLNNNQLITENFDMGKILLFNTKGALIAMNKTDLTALSPALYIVVLQNQEGQWSYKIQKNN